MIPYAKCKLYGPYKGKDGRLRVVLKHPNGRLQTVSYPKYWMENHLGRYLTKNEEVHHKDERCDNNNPSNFELKNVHEHRSEHKRKYLNFIKALCFQCKKEFYMTPKQQSYRNQNKKSKGPFCSRRCTGLYGKSIQLGL